MLTLICQTAVTPAANCTQLAAHSYEPSSSLISLNLATSNDGFRSEEASVLAEVPREVPRSRSVERDDSDSLSRGAPFGSPKPIPEMIDSSIGARAGVSLFPWLREPWKGRSDDWRRRGAEWTESGEAGSKLMVGIGSPADVASCDEHLRESARPPLGQ